MCAEIRLKPGSKKKVEAALKKKMAEKKKRVAQALSFVADEIVGEIQEELLSVKAIDQGTLIAATTRDPVQTKGAKLTARIHNDMEYASVIEYGRRPRQGVPPPLLPLVGWAGRKGIIKNLPRNISFDGRWAKLWAASGAIFRRLKEGKKSGKKKKQLDPEIKDMLTVRAIAQKIYEKGIEGRHPFTKVRDRRARTITKDVANVLRSLR